MQTIKDFLTTLTEFIKANMQPYITVGFTGLFLYQVATGTPITEALWQPVAAILTFWFGDTAISKIGTFIKITALTDPKSGTVSGGIESTGTPPKATSGTSTAAVGGAAVGTNYNLPADTWGAQGGWDAQKAAVPQPLPQVIEVTEFDRAVFDQKVIEMSKNTLSWSDMSPASLYNAAVTVYWGMFPVGDNVSLDMIQALIDYAEPAFMQIFELDSTKWTPQTYMTWLNTPADKCGGVCKPPITENKKVMLVRLGNYYATRAELESKLGK